jgi:ATP-dependent DNA ligase
MFRHACAMGLEGMISKRLTSRYTSGRCRQWLKVKNPAYERPGGRLAAVGLRRTYDRSPALVDNP